MPIYLDTSALIALRKPRDRRHASAVARLRSYVETNELLVAGWHTIVELIDGLVRHYTQKEAATELARLLRSPRIRVEDSEPHLPGAMELLRGRPNWGVDLSDCLSFALMKAKGIQRAFTYDQDFSKAGYVVEN